MNNLHLDRTVTHPACRINGYQHWTSELHWFVQRLYGLQLSQFDVFDCREYDSFESARESLIEMYKNNQYTKIEQVVVEPITYVIINKSTGERLSGTVRELARAFEYKYTHQVSRLVKGEKLTGGKLKDWRLK